MESVAFVQWCLDNLNYGTITLLMIIESSFIPFPSEIVVAPAAYRAASTGELNVVLVVVFATIGALIGALFNYALAYFVGRPVIYKFANSKFGHMCLIDQEKVEYAEAYFQKYGIISTFIGRLIPAVRQLISIPAGLAKMKMVPFITFTVLGAGVWNTILAAAGYYLESLLPEDEMMATISKYNHEFAIICGVLILIAIAVVAFNVWKGQKKKKQQQEDQQ